MNLSELLNLPAEFDGPGGRKYRPRKLDVLGLGRFSQRLQDRAFAALERQTDLPDDVRDRARVRLLESVAAGSFDPGGPAFLEACRTPAGASYALYLALAEEHPDLTEEDVRDLFLARLEELARRALEVLDPKAQPPSSGAGASFATGPTSSPGSPTGPAS